MVIQPLSEVPLTSIVVPTPTNTRPPSTPTVPPPTEPIQEPTDTPTHTPVPTNTVGPTDTPILPTATPTSYPEFSLGGGSASGSPGSTFDVPIQVFGLPETNSISFEVVYDENVLTFANEVTKTGTLLESWGLVDANEYTPGKIRVSAAALTAADVSGNGTLVKLKFNYNQNVTVASTTITLENLEDGVSHAVPFPITISTAMKGDVDGNGRITANDVELAFEISLVRLTPTEYQEWAAEVTGDDQVTAADVQRIFDATLGRADLTTANVTAKQSRRSLLLQAETTLSVGAVSGNPGDTIFVPIQITPAADISTVLIDLTYDTTKLAFAAADKTGTLVESFALADANEVTSGNIRVSAAALTADPISEAGTLINLQFTVLDGVSGTASVSITSTDDDLAGATTSDGSVTIGGAAVTSTPTPTPVSPVNTATATPVPVQHVFIYDDAGDTTGDLTGTTDFDAVDNRNITIAWDAEQGSATDWHIYVRKGFGGMKFLGRTADGTATSFAWNSDAENLDSNFANGPDFNSAYSFRVVRIDGQLGADDYFDMSVPVGFNLEGGNEVSLAQPELPNLNSGQIAIYDDILGGNNLAPMGSSGSDSDASSTRAIQIAWNFGRAASEVNEYHILVSIDGGEFGFLGQTYTSGLNYFWWTPNRPFRTVQDYAEGPQDGHTYQFKAVLSPLSGERATLMSGTLTYSVSGS